jgi:formamidopyrimidine-DNA glycosylase
MPELPEVETTRRGVEPLVSGRVIKRLAVREPRMRWPVSLPDLTGESFLGVSRRAKYLLFALPRGHLVIHLGMSGSLRVVPSDLELLTHDHLVIDLDDGNSLRLNDPRRFGSVHWHEGPPETHWLLAGLGIEPLDLAFDGSYLKSRARGRKVAVKNFIMDGRVVVGVGNIYANEALFLAGIRPTVPAGRVTLAAYEELAARIRQVLQAAIQMGGTTLRDFVNQDGNPGYFKQSLNVYDRAGEPCPACGSPLTGIRLGQRATVFCRKCQRAQGFSPPSC